MKWLRFCIGAFLLTAALGDSQAVRACPACADAIAASAGMAEEEDNFPTAMNQSIYLMIAVPYSALAIGGFLVYRGCKKNAEYRRALELAARLPSPVVVQSNLGAT